MKRLLIVFLFATMAVAQPTCKKGEYRSMDGRCLHDQTGEHHPAGDGCNTLTCMDAACRYQSETLMSCSHGDDPALIPPPKYVAPDLPLDGATSSGTFIISNPLVANLVVGHTTLFGSGDKLLEMTDEQNTVILTAYRDGHVVTVDPAKIDAAAKEFWMLMVKYMPQFCKEEKQ